MSVHSGADTPKRQFQVPEHLVPLELEREFLAGAFRAAVLADENPAHAGALAALVLIRGFDAGDFVYAEHRQVMRALLKVLEKTGTVSPGLVRDELRRRGHRDAMRMLPDVITFTWAPPGAMGAWVERIRAAAEGRREWAANLDARARLAGGE